MTISALGDAAVRIAVGEGVDDRTTGRVRALAVELERTMPPGATDVVGAFASVAVYFAPGRAPEPEALQAWIRAAADRAEKAGPAEGSEVELPVAYGGAYGPDLAHVAAHAKRSEADVVARHAEGRYRVQAIGFAPGFPYLGGLDPALACPRRATPRTQVPAGSVGIGGAQTGVYPLATPGGWNLIGRTPRRLFEARAEEPASLRVGDRVRFRAIPAGEYEESRRREAAAAVRREAVGGGAAEAGATVVRAGMFTQIQDPGRPGQRARGVPSGGAADAWSLRLANLAVGNPEEAPGLEFTLRGPELRFERDAVVAVAGGDFGVERGRPWRVRAGETVNLGTARSGCRGYLAVAGGCDVPAVLGGRGTDGRGGFGGFEGRALADGDRLTFGAAEPGTFRSGWRIDPELLGPWPGAATVRLLPAAEAAGFERGWESMEYRVSSRADRMGLRLEGPPLRHGGRPERWSAPVVPGTVQVPPDGRPIVLLAEAPTIGGYPELGYVIAADLSALAQLRPGDRLRFAVVDPDEARRAWRVREGALARLREGVERQWGRR